MTKAVRVHKVGGPEALVYESVDVPAPGPGEVRALGLAPEATVSELLVCIPCPRYPLPGTPLRKLPGTPGK